GEFTLGGSGMKSVPFVSAPHTYSESMTIGAHTVPAGVYIAVLALTMKGPLGVPGPIAAFGRKQQMVQFYESGV
ncbi:MAG: hypothetical protein ACE5FU_04920, partial [Nitrospinota bacterium]